MYWRILPATPTNVSFQRKLLRNASGWRPQKSGPGTSQQLEGSFKAERSTNNESKDSNSRKFVLFSGSVPLVAAWAKLHYLRPVTFCSRKVLLVFGSRANAKCMSIRTAGEILARPSAHSSSALLLSFHGPAPAHELHQPQPVKKETNSSKRCGYHRPSRVAARDCRRSLTVMAKK